ncbi:MAG TPA: hypothetical protein VMH00_12295 [Candidatus Limnocylindrales bacterium]|nr:hypothetical protein [Candidatus Limnocylindrales bacterium]
MKAAKRGKKATKRLKKGKKMEATKPLSGDAYRVIPGINNQTNIKPLIGDMYKII